MSELNTSSGGSKVGFCSGPGFTNMRIEYVVMNGLAIVEGDICLGTAADLENSSDPKQLDIAAAKAAMDSLQIDLSKPQSAGVIAGQQYRWPNCTIPYEIDPNLPNQTRITDAMNHWQQNTPIRFVRRTSETDYVYFTDLGGCSSMIGRRGGKQNISLAPGCTTGNAIHEIGHTVGLFHEQSRNDRDSFVRINWQNIQPGTESNFYQYLNSGTDIGNYDYCSIMHYPATAFSKNGQDTITPLQTVTGCVMGQRNGLSPSDIAAVNQIYPSCKNPKIDIVKNPRIDVIKKPWRDVVKNPLIDLRTVPVIDIKNPFRDVAKNPVVDPGTTLVEQPNPMTNPINFRRSIMSEPLTYDPYAPFVLAIPHMAPEWELVEQSIASTAKSSGTDAYTKQDLKRKRIEDAKDPCYDKHPSYDEDWDW